MAKSKHYYIRKTHRWPGVLLGIQFLMWTIGGLYFSWSNMDEVLEIFKKGMHRCYHPIFHWFPQQWFWIQLKKLTQ